MAEAVGVVASAITIAGLFKACIEAFEIIKAAQSQELDFQKAVLKLNIEKCRLYIWGRAMGLTAPPNRSQPRPLDTFEFKILVVETLTLLLRLFSNSSKMQDCYGCCKVTAETPPTELTVVSNDTDHVGELSACFSNFRLSNCEVDTSVKKKLRWLVQDRRKFLALAFEARALIDGLQDITKSISSISSQTEATASRIKHITQPDTLQLVADVCEREHPALSDAASIRLEIVSMAQTQCDAIEAWKDDIEPQADAFSEVESLTVTELKHRLLQYIAQEADHMQHQPATLGAGSSRYSSTPTQASGPNLQAMAPKGYMYYCPFRECKRSYPRRGFIRKGDYESHMQSCGVEWTLYELFPSLRPVPDPGPNLGHRSIAGHIAPEGHLFYCPFEKCKRSYPRQGLSRVGYYKIHIKNTHTKWVPHCPWTSLREKPPSEQPEDASVLVTPRTFPRLSSVYYMDPTLPPEEWPWKLVCIFVCFRVLETGFALCRRF